MSTQKISFRRFTALASETRDPTREPAEGDIYEVEDEENLPEDAKAQTVALFRNEDEDEDLPVHVWVNTTDQARYTGLSDHEKIDRDEGMLFDWGEFSTHGLTMRDMSFPIDMVFLDEHGYVQQIVERVQTDDPHTYTSACQYALELPSGFCEKHEIDTDWRVYREVRDFQTNPHIVELQEVPDAAVSYTDPDDVPENARTITGPEGGNYYIPADEDRRDEDPESESGLDLSERDAEIGDTSTHPAKWRRPEEGEVDEYIDEIQKTAFWSDGHEAFVEAFDGTQNTENEYTDEEGNWDEERLQQHEEWASELLNDDAATEEGEEPVGVILLGPPGAGKGWWQEQVDSGEYGESFGGREFTHISSDKTKEPIPEYNGENAAEVHDEASRMAKEELAPQAFEDEHNVVVDKVATSPDSTIAMVQAMQEAGYDIRASFVDVPEEKSVHNAVGRYEDEGRFTPLEYTASAREDSRNSFEEIVEQADIPEEKTGVFNNDVEWGEPPEPIEMGEDLLKFYRDFFGWSDEEMNRFIDTEDKSLPGDHQNARTEARPGDRDRRRDSRVDGRELRRGAERGDRGSSQPLVVDLDKQDDGPSTPYVEFSNFGGDPFQTEAQLEEFIDDLYAAGATDVYLGDEVWGEHSGIHDRPVRVEGLSEEEAEQVYWDHEDNVYAISQPTQKQEEDTDSAQDAGEIVRVDNVHQAPDDVVVHHHEDVGLYYVYANHTVERSLKDLDKLEISEFVRIWVRDKDDVPEGQEALEGDGPAGNEYYYYETIGNSNDGLPGAEGTASRSDQVAKGEYEYPDAGPEDAPGEVQEAVERFRSVVPEDTKEQTPLLYWLLGDDTPAYKMAKDDAAYQHEPKAEQRCGNCEYYYEGVDGQGICSQVRGNISPEHWCRLWDGLTEGGSDATVHTEGMNEDWYPITVIEAMAKQMDFELDIFRIVATEDMDMGLTSDLMAVGVDFPSHDVFVDWRTESWPDGEELDGPHVSIYSTMDDVRDVAQGEIEMITTIDPADGMSKQMSTPPGVPDQAEYLGPDQEVPEGASTYQGPQGATYYVPESTDNPDQATIEDFGGLKETKQPQTPDIDIDKGDRKEFLGYMSSGHERINDALRGNEEMTDDIRRHIDVVGSYIEDAPDFEEPAEVYRGLTASPDLADRLRQAEGEQVELGGFQSTSTNPEVANRFTDFGDEEDVPVMMNIQTQSGLPLENTNLDSGSGGEEQEVLLGHNWTYEIQSVEETDDGLLVDMEVVSDD